MSLDPRTPVLVGYGQVNQPDGTPDPQEPVALMAAAARAAADARVLAAVDAIRVVNLLSWRYRDPGLALGELIGADNPATRYTGVGGNVPQTLVNQACLDIGSGAAEVVLIAGAETWRSRARMKAAGVRPDFTKQDESVPIPPGADDAVEMSSPAQERIGLALPSHVYPWFEEALRVAAGTGQDEHRRKIGQLWARFNEVAQQNPHAWSNKAWTAEQIYQAGPDNRMISWPYTKLLNSNNMVDQGAVLILTSVEKADALQIPRERWVFPWAGTDAHDTYSVAERWDYARSPAIRIGAGRALELAGLGIDDIDLIDIYSCFPSAVQVAASEIGVAIDDPARPLTVTGGLTFAGGPWNNYVTHSIATMAEHLVAAPGKRGLITANGGYLTKHAFGVYSTEPPTAGFRWEDVQPSVDAEPTRRCVVDWEGVGTLETWTVPFGRDGAPEKAFVAVRTPDESRVLAVIADPDAAASLVDDNGADPAGAKIQVEADGRASLR
ncbi:acetyl-CoA acetyltransferase [[Mycobacterium] burgundiense]|uniref:Acetyl-CoA acetyltransferase n=1 Tax=[Mycobacterium] burgundiense TaxID=3064286 RepID=A0ABM9LQV6_9MYCO|nr:acetyl-CoA acetyltransferase [Mycolicibacterium sp. MU0053]CAJ1503192.1 acetyl-CoA acetyltransferase [Mycolicibacterium sp. MU0053]